MLLSRSSVFSKAVPSSCARGSTFLGARIRFSTARGMGAKKAANTTARVQRPSNASIVNRSVKDGPSAYSPAVHKLAARSSPTLLYQARSSTPYMMGCYLLGAFCFSYAGFNFWSVYLKRPETMNYYLATAVAGVCVGMAFFGAYSIFKTYRIVQTITAVPFVSSAGRQSLVLRIESARMLPGLGPRPVAVPASEVLLSGRLFRPSVKMLPEEQLAMRKREERQREMDRSRILTLPFRQAGYWMRRGFKGFQSILFQDDFLYIRIKGRNGAWRLARDPAWALNGGQAVDEVVKRFY